jgi:hypothetical protein
MSWTWNPGRIIGVNAVDPKPNPFVMALTPEQICLPWKSKSKKKRKWRGAAANIAKNPHFVTGLIPASNPNSRCSLISISESCIFSGFSFFSHPISATKGRKIS